MNNENAEIGYALECFCTLPFLSSPTLHTRVAARTVPGHARNHLTLTVPCSHVTGGKLNNACQFAMNS